MRMTRIRIDFTIYGTLNCFLKIKKRTTNVNLVNRALITGERLKKRRISSLSRCSHSLTLLTPEHPLITTIA